ncbi:uncharacterized protein APUU_21511S [Aspergillus puulaauensis]|uniref:Nucleoside phosphorylase domain-containing protein n=1 Tax=Aspergillus puulaauensis TaxID=1220207 RepID=A0A7R7XGW8_9EURO|nr:uncharacterized protein APUU_21511S [Aspergillus puulaauensis]BCS21079.1 hypothetical protein APUU_21511S [Aspergillus puulaauensis]
MAIDNQDHLSIAHPPKRQKPPQNDTPPRLSHDSYSVAWICALPIEMAAARAMLDETHETLPTDADDTNTYVLGQIVKHNIVIACLPATQYGTNNAANVATNLTRTFPSIRVGLMVGIGGGVPGSSDVRLGDVVVGTRVMQYDLGKVVGVGQLQRTAVPRIPHHLLGTAVSSLRAKHELGPSRVSAILQEKLRSYPGYARPALPDLLFEAAYDHVSLTANCDDCNQCKLLPRGRRTSDDVMIHYGTIASGNQVMRSGKMRDEVAGQLDVICFEMEAAGLMDILPCLSIRGICDYSDSHKTKNWQRYAAAVAAAYATELIEVLSVSTNHRKVEDVPDHSSTSEHREKWLDSLRFKRMEVREKTIAKEHARTCEWLLDHPGYNTWNDQEQQSQHNGFLWISGKPGAGKSTLMKFAFLKMKTQARSQNFLTASFFFNARGEFLERSIFGMYRSLLVQLLEGYPDLQVVLDNPDLVSPEENSLSLNAFMELLANAVMDLRDRQFVCFIDALDECDEQQVVDMVWYFEELAEQSASAGVQFRVCFSSRHYPHIAIERGIRLILEDQSGHATDMASYVDSRLCIKDKVLLRELRQKILEKAAGVFMWTVLVVHILNKEDRHGGLALRKRLAEIPSDLSELFRDILKRDNENVEQFVLATLWILYAKRPLRPNEFQHALWSGLRLRDVVDPQPPDFTTIDAEDRAGRLEEYVVSASKGLAEVTKSTQPTVQFIHESVRDFLVKDKGLLEFCPGLGVDFEGSSHERLKQCCYAYINDDFTRLSVDEMQPAEADTADRISLLLKRHPFLQYAAQQVLHHANAAATAIPQDEFLFTFCISDWVRISNLFQLNKHWHYTPSASMFYILAERGYSELIRTRLRRDSHILIPGERYEYPLFAALANSHLDAAVALLNLPSKIYNGIDITRGLVKRKGLKFYTKRTPLSWAVQEGRMEIVELLLQYGAPVDEMDARGRTPLSYACENGIENMARLFIQRGADVNSCNIRRGTALSLACANSLLDLRILHFEEGRFVITRDINGGTPLFWAARNCDLQTARLLIDKGADVNVRDTWGNTPLFYAARANNWDRRSHKVYKAKSIHDRPALGEPVSFCKFLLDQGADIHAINNDGNTPLAISAESGHSAVVSLLISKGANVNSRDNKGRTALSHAARKACEAYTKLLLDNGADPPAGDLEAPFSKHANVCMLLIGHGADPNARNAMEESPLHLAIRRC